MSEPPLDFGFKAMTDFWGQAGKAALQAQEGAAQTFGEFFKTIPAMMATGSAIPFAADATEPLHAVRALSDLWTAAASLSGSLMTMMTTPGGKGLDPTIEATFRAIADPRSWVASAGGLDSVIARMADGVQLADLWTAEREQARLATTWGELRRRALEHHAVVLEAWLRAGRAFSQALADHIRTHGRPPAGRAILDLWTSTANETLIETQRSDSFLESQAAMLRASAELRLAQRRLAEQAADQFDMPSRTELDDVHRAMTELRREVRLLRRQVAALGGQQQPVCVTGVEVQ
jgi:polyhydroxyalkanoate synthase subunit PhaE